MTRTTLAAAFAVLAAPAFADGHATGDAAAGEQAFARQCVSCHVVADADGNVLAGRNARTGPNLYNLVARGIAVEDFDYGDSIVDIRTSKPFPFFSTICVHLHSDRRSASLIKFLSCI